MNQTQLKKFIDESVDLKLRQMLEGAEKRFNRLFSTLAAEEKFSQFDNAVIPYNGSEIWVGLQNGINVQDQISNIYTTGIYSPEFTIVQGLSSVSLPDAKLAKYRGSPLIGAQIETNLRLEVTSDGSGDQARLNISTPIFTDFSVYSDAQIIGEPSIVKSPGSSGNTGSGWNGNLSAIPETTNVLFSFEVSELNTTYFIDVSFVFSILSNELKN